MMQARHGRPAIVVPPHPLAGTGSVYIGFGALGLMMGGCMSALAPNGMSVAIFVIGLLSLRFGRRFGAALRGLAAVSMGLQLLRQGRTDDAVSVVSVLPGSVRRAGLARRGVALVRATAALNEGALADAEREASAALPGGTDLLFGAPERQLRASAQAVRALARAGLGRETEALEDAREVFATEEADPHALAQASLAEALVLARKDDVEGLAAHLRARGRLVAEHGLPRDRLVYRGLRRLVKARRAGVYREPATREAMGMGPREPSAFARWAGAFAPGLAEVIGDMPGGAPPVFVAPHVSQVPATRHVPWTGLRALFLWSVLIVMFLTIWQLLTPEERVPPDANAPPRRSAPAREPDPPPWTVTDHVISGAQGAALVGLLVLIVLRLDKRSGRAARDLAGARRALALGDVEDGERRLDALTRRTGLDLRANGQYYAIACAELARRAVRRGDAPAAVARCDQGLAILASAAGGQAAASDLVLPWVLGERAVALAATRQPEAASAEVARVLSGSPGFPDAPTVTVRARFVADLARGVLDGAADTARSRTLDMPIPLHEDLLADVVLAARGVMPKDERERIAEELAEMPDVAAFVQALAPGLAAGVLGAGAPPAS